MAKSLSQGQIRANQLLETSPRKTSRQLCFVHMSVFKKDKIHPAQIMSFWLLMYFHPLIFQNSHFLCSMNVSLRYISSFQIARKQCYQITFFYLFRKNTFSLIISQALNRKVVISFPGRDVCVSYFCPSAVNIFCRLHLTKIGKNVSVWKRLFSSVS